MKQVYEVICAEIAENDLQTIVSYILEEGCEGWTSCSEMVDLNAYVNEHHDLGIDRRRGGNRSCFSDPPS